MGIDAIIFWVLLAPLSRKGLKMELDALDRQLLEELAAHGRLSNMELAQRVPLTHSAISRRIARLKKRGDSRLWSDH
jgi:DNA-binding transcriptional ArsR family regulator